jgi:hypothetical protein
MSHLIHLSWHLVSPSPIPWPHIVHSDSTIDGAMTEFSEQLPFPASPVTQCDRDLGPHIRVAAGNSPLNQANAVF